jgi:hypothetical protein
MLFNQGLKIDRKHKIELKIRRIQSYVWEFDWKVELLE